MKSPKSQVWKCLIALMILVGWVSLESIASVKKSETRSVRRKRYVTVNPNDTHEKNSVDIGKSLVEIAERASHDSVNQAVDLVFVIDGSLPMKALGTKVERRMTDMARVFEESVSDYQFALIWFQNLGSSKSPLNRCREGFFQFRKVFLGCRVRNLKVPLLDTGSTRS